MVRNVRGDLRSALLAGALLTWGAASVTVASAAWIVELPPAMQGAAYVGDSECLDCHDAHPAAYYQGMHGDLSRVLSDRSVVGCESCHGPASLHVDSREAQHILNPATLGPGPANGLCLNCHGRGHQDAYAAGIHGMNDVTCVSCHRIHGSQSSGLLRQPELDLCTSCHEGTRTETYLPSHHPLREGRMVCTDCHDPHADAFATAFPGERNVDLCLGCHAGKQGPFIFEHAPVVEDCLICHNAHGAVANSLLKQNEPFLCLQCHQTHFHATLQGIEGSFTTLDGYSGISHRNSAKVTFLTKCTQCHSEIHGSDLPSQSISGQGKALTR